MLELKLRKFYIGKYIRNYEIVMQNYHQQIANTKSHLKLLTHSLTYY